MVERLYKKQIEAVINYAKGLELGAKVAEALGIGSMSPDTDLNLVWSARKGEVSNITLGDKVVITSTISQLWRNGSRTLKEIEDLKLKTGEYDEHFGIYSTRRGIVQGLLQRDLKQEQLDYKAKKITRTNLE